MSAVETSFKVAAVQAAPVFLDLSASVEKAIALAQEAARRGCKLLVFPELFLPGYPFWIWLGAPAWGMQFVRRYHESSLVAGDRYHRALEEAAAKYGIAMVIGCSERDHGTLYISQVMIDGDGRTLRIRRKLRATHAERTVFGEGSGADLAVFDTSVGRLGAFSCWEHIQPLNRYALFAQHEQIHAASWPVFSLYPGRAYALGPEVNLAVTQSYAVEGQCFVVSACGVVDEGMIDTLIQQPGQDEMLLRGGGYARVYAPDGRSIGVDVPADQEGLVVAEVDLGAIALAKSIGDPVGHYARPDVTRLWLNSAEHTPVELVTANVHRPPGEPALHTRASPDVAAGMVGDAQG
ncbi:MAG TPA: carbon-nitrogen hydrolase family protein [Steroidobacteraceae bacterium]|nr:carbon-nitrogen hydrolase family protein [Steroidobacteraceae bacterium]